MSNYQLYQEILAGFDNGTALWEPSSSTSLSIGDVGYLRFGCFIRIFNATLPDGHPENENGVPENYIPLMIDRCQLRRTVLPKGIIAASGVQVSDISQDETGATLTFQCTEKVGAVAMTESEVIRENVTVLEPFAEYMAAHAHTWLRFARQELMREVALHELILLTGCDLTKGRYSVTVFNNARKSKKPGCGASFKLSQPGSKTRTWVPLSISYFQHNYGPPCNRAQCLFVRGFKILDRHVERMEREEEAASCIVDTCGSARCRGPLDAILRHLCDKTNADVVIAHDSDLAKLLEKDRVSCDYKYILKRLRKAPFTVHGQVVSLR